MNKLLGKQWVLGSDTAISPCGQSFNVHEVASNLSRHIASCSTCEAASDLVSAYNKIVESLPVLARIELDHWVHKVPWAWTFALFARRVLGADVLVSDDEAVDLRPLWARRRLGGGAPMTDLEARANALEQLAADHRGYAMNWPGRLVAVTWPPTGAALVFAVTDPAEPSFTTVRDLGEEWPQPMPYRRVMLEPRCVRWRWLDPFARGGYRESYLFVYSLGEAEHLAFMRFCH